MSARNLHAVGVDARRLVAVGVREDLDVLVVGDPEIDEKQATVVVVQPQHLREAEDAVVEGHGAVYVLDLERHVAEADDRFHSTISGYLFGKFSRSSTMTPSWAALST